MSNKKIDQFVKQRNRERRAFLSMLGRAGVSVPLLRTSPLIAGLFANRFAEAQNVNRKMFVSCYHPNGTAAGDTTGFVTGPSVQVYAGLPGVAMRSATISDPGGHGNIQRAAGRLAYFGEVPENSSIDVQMGRVLRGAAPVTNFAFGVRLQHLANNLSDVISVNNGTPSDYGLGPNGALSKVFSGEVSPVEGGPSQFDMRQAVLDTNRELLNKYRTKFGQAEREKLDTHFGALESLQERLNFDVELATAPLPGSDANECSTANGFPPDSALTPLQEYRAVAEVAVLAFSCGITNSIAIQFNETQASWNPNEVSDPEGIRGLNGDHHGANHGGGQHLLPDITAYMHKGVAHFIRELQAAGLYQNTVICVFSEMGQGLDHTAPHGPCVIASGSGITSSSQATSTIHTAMFNDAARLLGQEANIGGALKDYQSGSLL